MCVNISVICSETLLSPILSVSTRSEVSASTSCGAAGFPDAAFSGSSDLMSGSVGPRPRAPKNAIEFSKFERLIVNTASVHYEFLQCPVDPTVPFCLGIGHPVPHSIGSHESCISSICRMGDKQVGIQALWFIPTFGLQRASSYLVLNECTELDGSSFLNCETQPATRSALFLPRPYNSILSPVNRNFQM